MFNNYFKIKRIKSVFFAIVLIQAFLWGMFPGKADSKQYGEQSVAVTVTSDRSSCSDISIWHLKLSEWPDSLSNGSTFAVLFRFNLSDGWKISSVQGTEENFLLTWGDSAILLEGSLTIKDQFDPSMVLRIEVKKYGDTKRVCHLEPINDHENVIYFIDETGCVSTYPYRICTLKEEVTDTEITMGIETDRIPENMETKTETFESAEAIPVDMPVYVGCQETTVADHMYAVRFLFMGKGTPVICMEGGGLLSMDLTYTDTVDEWMGTRVRYYKTESLRGWSICTFDDLSIHRTYVFYVFTENGIVRIRYINGEFMGMDDGNSYF